MDSIGRDARIAETQALLQHGNNIHDDSVVPDSSDHESEISFLNSVRLYPGAVLWSMFFSLGIIMASYDPQLLGQLFAQPTFKREFGYLYNGQYIIEARWQSALLMGAPAGQVIGAFFATYPMEYLGPKRTFGICVVLTSLLICIQFTARTLRTLLVGEVLGGLVLGTYAIIAPAYASEVCPIALRGVLASYINLCFVVGQLIANGVIASTHKVESHWAYSAPFASQWMWPIIILCGLPFAPESPWWLARKGRYEEAEQALKCLASPKVNVKASLDLIVKTDKLEQKLEAGTTFRDCFRSINLRRTKIAIGVYSIQVISGIYLVSYTTYFFELAGLSTRLAFDLSIIFQAAGVLATVCSWYLLLTFGRRNIYNTGLMSLVILLIAIGILDCVPSYTDDNSIAKAQAALLIVWNFFYDLSIGPVCFVILSEVSATKLRSKTIAVAAAAQAAVGIAMTVIVPYIINPDQLNARGKIGFLFGGLSFIGLIWAFFSVPETKGRSYEELDIMFLNDVKTRDFDAYIIQ